MKFRDVCWFIRSSFLATRRSDAGAGANIKVKGTVLHIFTHLHICKAYAYRLLIVGHDVIQ